MKKGTLYAIAIASLIGTNLKAGAQDIAGKATHMLVYDGKLVIGGQFEKSDRRIVNNVTTWDGTKFAGLGKGVDGRCLGLAANGKNLYVAGDFGWVNKGTDEATATESNRVAKWDGTKWVSLGKTIIDREIFAIAEKDGKLYAGGNFTKVNDAITTRSMAMYDGKKWNALGNAQFDRAVTSMAFLGNDLYVGGIFTINGEEPMERFAKWDGKAWTEPVRGGQGNINAMVSDGKTLFLGGGFGVKTFDGTTLAEIPGGPTGGEVFGLCWENGKLYVAGSFTNVKVGKKDTKTGGIAMWDGNTWTAYPEVPYTIMRCVAIYNGVLYAGGQFETNVFNGICKFENGAWTKVQN